MKVDRENRYPIPPNISEKDKEYVIDHGLTIIEDEVVGQYVENITEIVADKLDSLWAIDSSQK